MSRITRIRAPLALTLALAVSLAGAAGWSGAALATPDDPPGARAEGLPQNIRELVAGAEAALDGALTAAQNGDVGGVQAALEAFFQAVVAIEEALRIEPQGATGGEGPPPGAAGGRRPAFRPGLGRHVLQGVVPHLGAGLARVVAALPEDARPALVEWLSQKAGELQKHPLVLAVVRAARHALGRHTDGRSGPEPARLAERLARVEAAIAEAGERLEQIAQRIEEGRARVEAMEPGTRKTVAELRLRAMELEYQRTVLLVQRLQLEAEALLLILAELESGL